MAIQFTTSAPIDLAAISKDALDIEVKPANAVWAVRYVRKEDSGAHATVMIFSSL